MTNLLTDMNDLLYNPPLIVWVFLGGVLVWLIIYRLKESVRPLTTSILGALADNAKQNVLLYVLALCLGMSATSDAIYDAFGNVNKGEWNTMGWWQQVALLVKSVKPMFATIAALLVNPPTKIPKTGNTNPPFPPTTPPTT